MANHDTDSRARRNTLANLDHWRTMLRRAGNPEWAQWEAAYERRLELIESGDVQVGVWQ